MDSQRWSEVQGEIRGGVACALGGPWAEGKQAQAKLDMIGCCRYNGLVPLLSFGCTESALLQRSLTPGCMQVPEKNKRYGISSVLSKPFDPSEGLVVQVS